MDFVDPIAAVVPGVQGRVLAVLAQTSTELSLRNIARLSGVSPAQASRVLGRLVDLGLVERREVPPASLFRLVEGHVASRLIVELSRARPRVLEAMRRAATTLPARSVVAFGSFARGEADADSDIDVVVVRPAHLDEDELSWTRALDKWRHRVRCIAGNRVEVLEVDEMDVARLIRSRAPLWSDIRRDGVLVAGVPLMQNEVRRRA